jgi:hypothetical protein
MPIGCRGNETGDFLAAYRRGQRLVDYRCTAP